MTIQTIPDPPAECTGVNPPRLHKRRHVCGGGFPHKAAAPRTKDLRRKRPHLIAKYGMKCFWCGTSLTPETLTIDHYIPLSRGGSNKIKNLRLACDICNNKRGNALPWEVRYVH